jgi:hypothetical protein
MAITRTTIGALLVAGCCWVATSSAQVQGDLVRYPWDNRWPKCFAPGGDLIEFCREPANWPDFATTVGRVQSLLMAQDTTLLHRATVDLALGSVRFKTGQYHFEAWYRALRSQLPYVNDNALGFIEGWRKSEGTASPAIIVDAIALLGQAWRARGNDVASTVSPEAWTIFYEKLAQADALLDSASSEVKRLGPWHILKVQLAYGQRDFRHKRFDVLKDAVAAWPDSTLLYETPMAMSSPAWGGSFELMDAVARVAAQSAQSRTSAAMYALVYEQAFRGSSTYSLLSTKVDWNLVKQGFQDLERSGQFPSWIWQNFASLACQMRDRDEAKRLYELHDRQAGSTSSPKSSDPCRAFAYGH